MVRRAERGSYLSLLSNRCLSKKRNEAAILAAIGSGLPDVLLEIAGQSPTTTQAQLPTKQVEDVTKTAVVQMTSSSAQAYLRNLTDES